MLIRMTVYDRNPHCLACRQSTGMKRIVEVIDFDEIKTGMPLDVLKSWSLHLKNGLQCVFEAREC